MVQLPRYSISTKSSAFGANLEERSDLSHLRAGITDDVSDAISPRERQQAGCAQTLDSRSDSLRARHRLWNQQWAVARLGNLVHSFHLYDTHTGQCKAVYPAAQALYTEAQLWTSPNRIVGVPELSGERAADRMH